VGQPGELLVGGPLLARGYLNRPAETAERFPTNPFLPAMSAEEEAEAATGTVTGWRDRRLYRTGDLAVMLEGGFLQVLGRCKFMYKIRGYSVVPGKVEASLVAALRIKAAAVICDGDEGGEKRLVAFIVKEPWGQAHDPRPVPSPFEVGPGGGERGWAPALDAPGVTAQASAGGSIFGNFGDAGVCDTTAAGVVERRVRAVSLGDGRLSGWRLDEATGACADIHKALEGLLPAYM